MSVEPHYLIIARSITHAQRIEQLLLRAGVHCCVFRAPMEVAGRGCAYAVRIGASSLQRALTVIHGAGLSPVSVFMSTKNGYQEESL